MLAGIPALTLRIESTYETPRWMSHRTDTKNRSIIGTLYEAGQTDDLARLVFITQTKSLGPRQGFLAQTTSYSRVLLLLLDMQQMITTSKCKLISLYV